MKKTVVIGASPTPSRYAHHAVERLHHYGHEVVPIGIREGTIAGIPIVTGTPALTDVDTVTLYIRPKRQKMYYEYILETLQPKRIVFNPGTENPQLLNKAREAGIQTEMACTLVMLATGVW